jgi:hypothetical protein
MADNGGTGAEMVRVFPDGRAVTDFLGWLARHQLVRRQLLDSLLASTFHQAGVKRLITNNKRDFTAFGCFEIVTLRS